MNDRAAQIDEALGRLKLDRFDQQAWTSLYDNVVPRARAIAFRVLTGDPTSSQDAVHDALVRLMRYTTFERFASADEFLRYFTTIVHRAALDLRRRRDAEAGPVTIERPLGPGSPDFDIEAQAENRDTEQGGVDPAATLSFKKAVENLSNSLSKREMLVCTLLASGYERKEIAARLGATEPTTAVIVHRLRAKLRELGHEFRTGV